MPGLNCSGSDVNNTTCRNSICETSRGNLADKAVAVRKLEGFILTVRAGGVGKKLSKGLKAPWTG